MLVGGARRGIGDSANAGARPSSLEVSFDVGFDETEAHAVHAILGLVAGEREAVL